MEWPRLFLPAMKPENDLTGAVEGALYWRRRFRMREIAVGTRRARARKRTAQIPKYLFTPLVRNPSGIRLPIFPKIFGSRPTTHKNGQGNKRGQVRQHLEKLKRQMPQGVENR